MPLYKYTGSGMRVGATEMVHGAIYSLPSAPNRHFELIEEEKPKRGEGFQDKAYIKKVDTNG